jgi:hypothetical protein
VGGLEKAKKNLTKYKNGPLSLDKVLTKSMDFVRSYFGTNVWPKSEEKSVQLVRGSFVPK